MGYLSAAWFAAVDVKRFPIGQRLCRSLCGRWLLLAFALLIGALPSGGRAATEIEVASESRVKAAFVYKFAEYVEWPDGRFDSIDEPFTIGIIGDDAVLRDLQAMVAGRAVGGRPLAVRRLEPAESIHAVQLIFVGRGSRAALARVAADRGVPVLVVSEFQGALNEGAAINFIVSGTRLRFEVSIDNAEMRGLKLGSRLLSVAANTRR